jgi:hypothetical protein
VTYNYLGNLGFIMTYLLFTVALSLSALAAYYAVMGLIAIFAAAVVPIALMGSLLEASKLVVASWLYRNWKEIPSLMKSYFTIALIVLMMLTSMGIFGFLSKAHLDQAVPSGDVAAKLALIDEKIKTEKENINASRKELNQLDQQVDQTIGRTTDAGGAERAIAIRRGQQKDRTRILNEIGQAQTKVAKYNEERAPIASEVRKVEAEVGPIKYIAALIYGDNLDEGLLEKAVRIVTIMIVIVFDPLAVLLLIGANWQQKKDNREVKEIVEEEPDDLWEESEIIEENPKELVIQDEVIVEESSSSLVINQMVDQLSIETSDEEPLEQVKAEVNELLEEEIPELDIDEHSKDWEPLLFKIKRGDVITEAEYPDNKDVPPKTSSFIRKTIDFLRLPSTGVKTIEKEVDELQKK